MCSRHCWWACCTERCCRWFHAGQFFWRRRSADSLDRLAPQHLGAHQPASRLAALIGRGSSPHSLHLVSSPDWLSRARSVLARVSSSLFWCVPGSRLRVWKKTIQKRTDRDDVPPACFWEPWVFLRLVYADARTLLDGLVRVKCQPFRVKFQILAPCTARTARVVTVRTERAEPRSLLPIRCNLAIADDAIVRYATASGIPGTSMPAFAQSAGGMLTDKQVDVIVRGIRDHWLKPDVLLGADPPPYSSSASGDSTRGSEVYAKYCSSCHGAVATEGKQQVPSWMDLFLHWSAIKNSERS